MQRGYRGGPAGSCRRLTRARRHEPADRWGSLIVTLTACYRLRLGAIGDAERERARRVVIGGVHDDFVLARLRECRRQPRVAVAARVVILEVPAAGNPGPAQEEVRIECIGFEI